MQADCDSFRQRHFLAGRPFDTNTAIQCDRNAARPIENAIAKREGCPSDVDWCQLDSQCPRIRGRSQVADRQLRNWPGHTVRQAEFDSEIAAEREARLLQIDKVTCMVDVFIGIEIRNRAGLLT
jgi:hypothetical protein